MLFSLRISSTLSRYFTISYSLSWVIRVYGHIQTSNSATPPMTFLRFQSSSTAPELSRILFHFFKRDGPWFTRKTRWPPGIKSDSLIHHRRINLPIYLVKNRISVHHQVSLRKALGSYSISGEHCFLLPSALSQIKVSLKTPWPKRLAGVLIFKALRNLVFPGYSPWDQAHKTSSQGRLYNTHPIVPDSSFCLLKKGIYFLISFSVTLFPTFRTEHPFYQDSTHRNSSFTARNPSQTTSASTTFDIIATSQFEYLRRERKKCIIPLWGK